MKLQNLLLFAIGIVITTSAYAQQSPDGLLYYWNFDEGIGAVTHDSIGGMDGQLMNGVFWTNEAIYGKAIEFNGVDGYVDLPDGFADFTNGYTFSFWAFPKLKTYAATFIEFGNGRGLMSRFVWS